MLTLAIFQTVEYHRQMWNSSWDAARMPGATKVSCASVAAPKLGLGVRTELVGGRPRDWHPSRFYAGASLLVKVRLHSHTSPWSFILF